MTDHAPSKKWATALVVRDSDGILFVSEYTDSGTLWREIDASGLTRSQVHPDALAEPVTTIIDADGKVTA